MPVEDSNPERRNLSVLSMAIIIYYQAGGYIADKDIHLQFVNVKFSHPEVLIFFVWGMLIWFLWRYWLTNKGKFNSEFEASFRQVSINHPIINSFVEKKIGYKRRDPPFQDLAEVFFNYVGATRMPSGQWDLRVQIGRATAENAVTKVKDEHVILGKPERKKMALVVCLTTPCFTSYIVPYLLFICAVFSPIFHLS